MVMAVMVRDPRHDSGASSGSWLRSRKGNQSERSAPPWSAAMRLLRATVRIAPFVAFLLLAACGPKSIVSTIFPERQTLSSTVVFDDAAGRTPQTIRYSCKIIDQTDSIAANIARE